MLGNGTLLDGGIDMPRGGAATNGNGSSVVATITWAVVDCAAGADVGVVVVVAAAGVGNEAICCSKVC